MSRRKKKTTARQVAEELVDFVERALTPGESPPEPTFLDDEARLETTGMEPIAEEHSEPFALDVVTAVDEAPELVSRCRTEHREHQLRALRRRVIEAKAGMADALHSALGAGAVFVAVAGVRLTRINSILARIDGRLERAS